jgi:subtilisin family serine protease
MRYLGRVRLLPAILLMLALVIPTTGVLAAPAYQANNLQTVIVGLNPGAGRASTVADEFGRKLGGQRGFVYSHAFNGFSMTLPEQAISALQRDPRIAFVELDQAVYALDMPTGVDRIEADKYHDVQSGGAPGSYAVPVNVAIIDTGIASHPDLNVVGAIDCTYTDWLGRASCRSNGNSDDNGHGTHVAGTVGGYAGGGAVGVAPGARLWSVKVLRSDGSGSMSMIIAGIDWVTSQANNIQVANMSLGCECSSSALNTALNNSTSAGIVYVAAAGNSAKNASTFSPANHPRVIAVSAMADFDGKPGGLGSPTCRSETDDGFAGFSNFGSTVDLAAPGVCIRSTWPGGGYNVISGTSMASPHVAGAAALYIAANGVPKTSTRWSVVKAGLLTDNWSVLQNHECGFTGGKSAERSLMLADCGEGAPGGDEPVANTPPTAAITSPTSGNVSGTVTIQVSASDAEDAAGSLTVEVRINSGAWQNATYNAVSGRYEWAWNTTLVGDGNNTIDARATDTASEPLTTNATPVTVTVDNAPSNTAPVVGITSPTGGNVEGTVTIHVTASDAEDADDGLNVEVRIGSGSWQAAIYSSGTYQWAWNTTSVVNGNHSISARATDSAGATTNASSVTVNVNNPLPVVSSMHVASLSGSSQRVSTFSWRAHVTVRMVDSNGASVSGATVHGRWSNGATVSCTTVSTGQCTVSSANLSIFSSSIGFQVTDATHSSLSYNAQDNVVTSIVVSR